MSQPPGFFQPGNKAYHAEGVQSKLTARNIMDKSCNLCSNGLSAICHQAIFA
jgi:hypothetical protein